MEKEFVKWPTQARSISSIFFLLFYNLCSIIIGTYKDINFINRHMVPAQNLEISIIDLLRGDLQLASPPNLYFELIKTTENPAKTVADAGKIIEKDPGLTARLLKIVNSAFYGFPAQISTVTHAASIIGIPQLETLVLSTLVIDKFSSMPKGLLSMQEFWEKSLFCALIAKQISEFKDTKTNSELLFVCGLLHEIGCLIFYRKIPTLARAVGLRVESSGEEIILTEKKMIGFDHYQTGAELTKLWNLPEIISMTIQFHENPENAVNFTNECRLIKQASCLSQNRIFNAENFTLDGLFSEFSNIDLHLITQQAYMRFDEVFKFFYAA